jgi:hypothetical protein
MLPGEFYVSTVNKTVWDRIACMNNVVKFRIQANDLIFVVSNVIVKSHPYAGLCEVSCMIITKDGTGWIDLGNESDFRKLNF